MTRKTLFDSKAPQEISPAPAGLFFGAAENG